MVAGLLRSLVGAGQRRQAREPDAATARILSLQTMPEAIYAVGDVHGCLDLYRRMEDEIIADARRLGVPGPCLIVLLGDMVDRGPDTAGMIRHLLSPPPDGFERVVLRGNHEDMMVAFLNDPAATRRWLDFGGKETLMSYGLHPDPEHGFCDLTGRFRARLDAAIPDAHRAFLARTPFALQVENTVFCHAGLDPARPVSAQKPAELIWGDPDRLDSAETNDHLLVVHGHVITPEILITPRRINVDTGAYMSGVLSAVRLVDRQAPFALSVTRHPR